MLAGRPCPLRPAVHRLDRGGRRASPASHSRRQASPPAHRGADVPVPCAGRLRGGMLASPFPPHLFRPRFRLALRRDIENRHLPRRRAVDGGRMRGRSGCFRRHRQSEVGSRKSKVGSRKSKARERRSSAFCILHSAFSTEVCPSFARQQKAPPFPGGLFLAFRPRVAGVTPGAPSSGRRPCRSAPRCTTRSRHRRPSGRNGRTGWSSSRSDAGA